MKMNYFLCFLIGKVIDENDHLPFEEFRRETLFDEGGASCRVNFCDSIISTKVWSLISYQ